MKVILTKDVTKVGKDGEIVVVADGFARNYLLPRGLARDAAGGALKQHEHHKAAEEKKSAQLLSDAEKAQASLEGKTVTITAKAGEGERLYGSITAADIADAVKTSTGVSVDKRKVQLMDHIKAVGTFHVPIKLHRDITVEVTVSVQKAA
jgi:large subunit ribosomal protein L9